ncbi:MAG TPA: fasciclin domain-containing protein [Candidatus Limnocylindrales bacterium]|nr:fasciclin domain-containing protein [Candidatus Limnocylindrales bacterium]
MRKLFAGATAALLALTVAAASVLAAPGAKPGDATIVDIVLANDGEFDVLQAAVIEAGLVGALSSTDDQYTVFAPTDWAFVETFRGILGDPSLTEADVVGFIESGGVDTAFGAGALADILLYHVTNGRRISPSVIGAPGYTMLNGDRLSRTELVGAGIVNVDISASNGVIHVIGSVLLP